MNRSQSKNQNDQASELKKLLNDIDQNHYNHLQDQEQSQPKIDVLNLPPRKEVHKDRYRFQLSMSKHAIRFFIVILCVISLAFLLYHIDVPDYFFG